MHAAGLATSDAEYVFDVRGKNARLRGDRGSDIRALRMALLRRQQDRIDLSLFRALESGPLPPDEAKEYASVYHRGMDELAEFLTTR